MENYAKILEAINQIADEKSIPKEEIIQAVKEGFQKAFERFFDPEALTEVELDEQTGVIKMYLLLKVVQQVEDDWLEIGINQASEEFGDNVAIGDLVRRPIQFEDEFSRLAVHQVRQIIQQKIRGAERNRLFEKFVDQNHQLLTGKIVGANDRGDGYLIEVDGVTTSLWNKKLIPGDHFEIGDLVSFYVDEVQKENRFSPISISRTAPGFLRRILEREVPEVGEDIIDIKGISREPGIRAKVAVYSFDQNVEPIGAIVGVHGSRISKISELLNGEKIDVVLWNEDLNTFIMSAMTPVRVVSVDVDEENNEADIIVPNEQLSLAIGKSGVAARLVANLLKMKINILSVKQAEELGIENKWNGNISAEELASKEFLEATNRRKSRPHPRPNNNNSNNSHANNNSRPTASYKKPVSQTNDDILKELEQELERFQAEIAGVDLADETVVEADADLTSLTPEETPSDNLEEIEENLRAFDEALDLDEDPVDDDNEEDNDDYDSYYD